MKRIEVFLSADSAKYERRLGLYHLTIHLKQRVYEKIDWAARRLGINYQVAAFRQLETIGRIVAEVVIGQFWIFPRFADIHRDPSSVGEKFGPAMIAVDRALVLIDWNRGANSETRWYANTARQRNEVGMKIRAVASARVARVERVAAAPARA